MAWEEKLLLLIKPLYLVITDLLLTHTYSSNIFCLLLIEGQNHDYFRGVAPRAITGGAEDRQASTYRQPQGGSISCFHY